MISSLRSLAAMIYRSPVSWMFLTTALRVGGFFLVMGFALRTLATEDMGLWFVLTNMTSLVCAVEIGFHTAISRTASYLSGGMSQVPPVGGLNIVPRPGQPNVAALAGLVDMSRKLYRWFAVLVGCLFFGAGGVWLIFVKPGYVQSPSQWLTFLLIGLATTVNMASLFWWPLLFGLNRVRQYNQLQIGGLLASYGVSFAGLRLGWGLPVLAVGNFLLNFVPRQASRRLVTRLIPADAFPAATAISWRLLWPITWRTGVVTLASLMMVNATTLVCAQVFDLRTAASYGLSMQLGLMLHGLSQSWLVVKYPELSMLRARGESRLFNRIVRRRILLSLASYGIGAITLVAVLSPVMRLIRSNTLPLEPAAFSWLLLALGLDLFVNLHAAVLITSENATPHLRAYVLTGGIAVTLAFLLSRAWGVGGLIAAPLIALMPVLIWWVPWRCWKSLAAAARCDMATSPVC